MRLCERLRGSHQTEGGVMKKSAGRFSQVARSEGVAKTDGATFSSQKKLVTNPKRQRGNSLPTPRLRFGLVSGVFNALTILVPHAYDGEFAQF